MGYAVLIIEDEEEIASILREDLTSLGCQVHSAADPAQASKMIETLPIDIVCSDIHMPGMSGLQFLAECREKLKSLPTWIFITADVSPETFQKACVLGAIDILQKPFSKKDLEKILNRIRERSQDSIHEIMDIVQAIAGIQLGKEKRLLVETRLMRRARSLGIDDIENYKKYFQAHRETEVQELISNVTTHTTSFFRESDHFDFFHDRVIPELLRLKRPLQIWSAACSTGEEVYSLAICFHEALRAAGVRQTDIPPVEFLGTDIDFHSIRVAQNGVYEVEALSRLNQDLVQRYFDVGTGELEGLVRLKDSVFRLCKFKQMNLLSSVYSAPQCDVIFIRNVLIYFNSKQIEEIVRKLEKHLHSDGYLFIGHSETLQGLNLPVVPAGHAIYQRKKIKTSSSSLTRVMVVDDSPTVRKTLKRILDPAFGFEVVAEAANPIEAEKIRATTKVDVMTLDIHMPEMDGISYLKQLQNVPHPPIVMLSSINSEDAVHVLKCLELGAVDYLEKPNGLSLDSEGERIRSSLQTACQSKRVRTIKSSLEDTSQEIVRIAGTNEKSLILIGASTGGTEAIRTVIERFPEDSPPVLIVQHIPAVFSKAFAERLNEICKIQVKEAEDGEPVLSGYAYIAPGGKQMRVIQSAGLKIQITNDAPVNRHQPSVDYLFDSCVRLSNQFKVTAALLTGMGADGARGLKLLRDAGVHTIAQDEDSCVVFGMPKEAIALGGADEILPLPSIPYHLFKALSKGR